MASSSSGAGPRGRVPAMGPRFHPSVLDPHQHLGGRAGDRRVAVLQEVHVGRGVHHAQRAVDRERIDDRSPRSAGARAPPGRCRRPRCTPWPCARPPGTSAPSRVSTGIRSRRRPGGSGTSCAPSAGPPRSRRASAGRDRSSARCPGSAIGDEHEPLPDVVEGHQRAVERERGEERVLDGMAIRDPLEEPDRVVGEVADRAPGEPRQPGHLGGRRAEARAQRRQQVLRLAARPFGVLDDDTVAAHLDGRHRIAAEERITGEALAAHDALEKEGALGARGEGEERGHRRLQVSRDLAEHRHEAAFHREPLVVVEGQRPHAFLRRSSTSRALRRCRDRAGGGPRAGGRGGPPSPRPGARRSRPSRPGPPRSPLRRSSSGRRPGPWPGAAPCRSPRARRGAVRAPRGRARRACRRPWPESSPKQVRDPVWHAGPVGSTTKRRVSRSQSARISR